VRVSIGHAPAALVFVLASEFLLQANDSVISPPATQLQLAMPPQVITSDVTSDRDYFVSHQQVVALGRQTIDMPILMYHYIRTPPSPLVDLLGYNLSVSPHDFEVQMDWLATHGYHPVDFNDVRAYFAGVRPLPSRPVVITLDDGYRDLYTTAYPILASHGFKAVAYIVSGFVGWGNQYVTADMIVDMDRHGIEIACHTVNHANLARASWWELMYELVTSKHYLEKLVGHPVIDFAYPSGRYNQMVIAALKATGYDTAVTEQYSTEHSRADRYTWTRDRVSGGETLANFILYLGPVMPSVTETTVNVETAGLQPLTNSSSATFPAN
jgi:peptidoglycan/xylan/chitin deacetylase (PgdA/CDA1 family)